jgi:hypothetical protein
VRGFKVAPLFAAMGLKKIGVEAAKIGLKGELLAELTFDPINGLKDIGAKAAERGFKKWDITNRAAEGLRDIGMNSEDKYLAVNGLWYLGAFVMEYLPGQVDQIIRYLKEIEKESEIATAIVMRWGGIL